MPCTHRPPRFQVPAPRSAILLAAAVLRSSAVRMGGNSKKYAFENFEDGLFEAREVSIVKPPVYFLSRVNELGVLTSVSELGLLSAAAENGVFTKLESVGAFSAVESLLKTGIVEKLKLLSTFESLLDVDAGLIYTGANFCLALLPTVVTLEICGFLPKHGPGVTAVESLFCLSTGAVGVALFVAAFLVGVLQEDPEDTRIFK